MFTKIVSGVVNSATEFAESATTAAGAMASIASNWKAGDPIDKTDVVKLAGAGFTMVEIASFFGVAERVIQEILAEEENEGK